jgi:hypothetical protein
MKKVPIITCLVIAFTGCLVDRDLVTNTELAKWTVTNDTIYYGSKPVAYYDHSEYELNPGHGCRAKIIQELSITQVNFEVKTDELIKYVHTRHSKQKVEIVVPRH